MPVVRRVGRTEVEYQRRLAISSSTAGALGVICRIGGYVAHVHDGQQLDVDAQLHRGRAKQRADVAGAELFLPLNAQVGAQLAGVFIAAEGFPGPKIVFVQALKKRIGFAGDDALIGAILQSIGERGLLIAGFPDNGINLEPIQTAVAAFAGGKGPAFQKQICFENLQKPLHKRCVSGLIEFKADFLFKELDDEFAQQTAGADQFDVLANFLGGRSQAECIGSLKIFVPFKCPRGFESFTYGAFALFENGLIKVVATAQGKAESEGVKDTVKQFVAFALFQECHLGQFHPRQCSQFIQV